MTDQWDKSQNEPQNEDELREAALMAGWNGEGPVPTGHALPPPIDPELGNNGIPPTDAPRVK